MIEENVIRVSACIRLITLSLHSPSVQLGSKWKMSLDAGLVRKVRNRYFCS
jgi:hypothetical protein